MIEGLVCHETESELDANYVDTHGQSEIGFAFTELLGYRLLPRLKRIGAQRLYRPASGEPDRWNALAPVLSRPINWDLIASQYDQMIRYTTAIRLGTADTEAILRRFTRSNVQHPTYRALAELGKALRTIFLCDYLTSIELRREIQEGLNVVENWNSANGFIHYGKGGDITSNQREDQEIAVLCLHLLQVALVYINTLMIQQIVADPTWTTPLTAKDLRALTPLTYSHVNPYGYIHLDMTSRLALL
jgi:TnpA family transposase